MAAAQEPGAPCLKVPAGKKRHYHHGHRVDPDYKNRGGRQLLCKGDIGCPGISYPSCNSSHKLSFSKFPSRRETHQNAEGVPHRPYMKK